MLLISLLWGLASIIMISIGDFFVTLYNKLTKREEVYGVTDSFLLGLCFILFPLGISAIWLPSNMVMLAIYVLFSILYWICMPVRRKALTAKVKEQIVRLNYCQLLLITVIIVSMLMVTSWTTYMYDAVNYNYQLTAWYEQYSAVPGIVNIESRLGFNSNYLLLSALFSLQSYLGEPVYIIQSLLATYFAIWIVLYIIRSNYEVKGLILLALFSIFLGINWIYFSISSTDILPALLIFYVVASLTLHPDKFDKKFLLLFIIPFAIVTLKLSVAAFGLISVCVLFSAYKAREYKTMLLLCTLGLCIVCPWLIRNVIISGYLIYPLYELDFFSFDWKAPAFVTHLEKGYIKDYGWHEFEVINTLKVYRHSIHLDGVLARNKLNLAFALLTLLVSILAYISPFIIAYKIFRAKLRNKTYITLAISLVFTIIVWFSAPDFRFISGVFFSIIFLMCCVSSPQKKFYAKLGKITLPLFVVILFLSAGKKTFNYYHEIKELNAQRPFLSFLYKPYGVKAQKNIKLSNFDTYMMGELPVYLSNELGKATYNYIPCTFITKDIETIKHTKKFYPIQGVEARGSQLEDGFRPIPNFNMEMIQREDDWWTNPQK